MTNDHVALSRYLLALRRRVSLILRAALIVLSTASVAHAQVDVLYIYNALHAGTPSVDMCMAIATAAQTYPGLTLDARGFFGSQYCSAANATTMLGGTSGINPTTAQGKLLLGDVTMVIDGPSAGYYTDGTSTPSTYGTPAIIIPNQYWGSRA